MNTADRYKFEKNGSEITFMPHYYFLRTLRWWLAAGILAVPVGYWLKDTVNEKVLIIAFALWVVYMGYLMVDLVFRVPVKYIFDKREKSIYRKHFTTKKIMNFDEMTYFINEDSGGYYYAIAKKRSQFIKNYKVSNYFSGSQSSREKENEFLQKILYPVLDALEQPINRPL